MMLCLSIRPRTMAQALRLLKEAPPAADLVELRVDGLEDLDLPRLLAKPRPRVIITNRHREEGGTFDGRGALQLSLLSEAAKNGAEFVDVEMRWGSAFVRKLMANGGATRVICSHHDFEGTPGNLAAIYRSMRRTGAPILKIVTTAEDISDNRMIFELLRVARHERQPLISFCMGEKGEISRILGGTEGAFLSYAARTPAECTAPGQLTLDLLGGLFRAGRLNRRTKLFGLIGNPVRQSKGIFFHNAAFKRWGLNAIYVNLLVDVLEKFLEGFRDTFTGLSVTMPFKQAILPRLDRVEAEARELGAVNTVIRRRGALSGFNTDLTAVSMLLRSAVALRGKAALVLGAGATAKTMAFAALMGGARATLAGRNPEKTERAAQMLGCGWTTIDRLSSDERYDVIMNATPVGMASAGAKDASLLPTAFLRRGTVVLDAVYDPPMTPLLRAARRAGCRVITGREMFLRQAKLQSRLFRDSLQ